MVRNGLNVLPPHTHHLGAIIIVKLTPEDALHLASLLQSKMPALQKFRCFPYNFDATHEVFPFTPDRHPRLTSLTLGNIQHPVLEPPALAQLRYLSLIRRSPGLRHDHLMELLRGCVNVEMLHLCGMFLDPPDGTTDTHACRFALSNLCFVTLELPPRLTRYILDRLTLPAHASLTLRQNVTTTRPTELNRGFHALLPDDPRALPMLSLLTKAEVRLLGYSQRVVGYRRRGTNSLDRGFPRFTGWAYTRDYLRPEDFMDILRDAPLEELHVALEKAAATVIDWRPLFALFPKLRVLSIRGDGTAAYVAEIFVGLNPDVVPESIPDERRIVCPRLERVRLEGFLASESYFASVVGCLQKRCEYLRTPTGLETLSCQFDGGQGHAEEAQDVGSAKSMFVNAVSPLVSQLEYE